MLKQNVNNRDFGIGRQHLRGTITTMASQPGCPVNSDAVPGADCNLKTRIASRDFLEAARNPKETKQPKRKDSYEPPIR